MTPFFVGYKGDGPQITPIVQSNPPPARQQLLAQNHGVGDFMLVPNRPPVGRRTNDE
jgi:hypothetical protein